MNQRLYGCSWSQTYTPRPLYINTPHPRVEAYRIGIGAYQRNQIDFMLLYMQQATTFSPGDPDLVYYIGEAYRLKGEYDEAMDAYQNAIAVNPAFAPPYLGLALLRLEQNPDVNVTELLHQAIQRDPNYADAYLTRAAYWLYHGEPALALEDLGKVETIEPGLPMMYVLTAQAHLELGDYTTVLQYAQRGYEADRTLLPAYITLAQCYLINNDADQALTMPRYIPAMSKVMHQPGQLLVKDITRGGRLLSTGFNCPGSCY